MNALINHADDFPEPHMDRISLDLPPDYWENLGEREHRPVRGYGLVLAVAMVLGCAFIALGLQALPRVLNYIAGLCA